MALGALFFARGDGLGVGVSLGVLFFARGDGLGVGVSLGLGVWLGEGCGVGVVVANGDGRGVVGVGVGFGVADDSGVTLGLAFGFGVAGAPGEGLGLSFFCVAVFRFLRDGVGVGVRTKKSLIFLENASSSSSIARTGATIANAIAIMIEILRIRFISARSSSGCQLLQDSFIHPDAGVEILQRKVFVGGVGPAIGQGET